MKVELENCLVGTRPHSFIHVHTVCNRDYLLVSDAVVPQEPSFDLRVACTPRSKYLVSREADHAYQQKRLYSLYF
jgi:hypothetical protein